MVVDRILMIILVNLRWEDLGCNGGDRRELLSGRYGVRAVIIGLEFRAIW